MAVVSLTVGRDTSADATPSKQIGNMGLDRSKLLIFKIEIKTYFAHRCVMNIKYDYIVYVCI